MAWECGHVTRESVIVAALRPRRSFPPLRLQQIHFLSAPSDAIQHTGNDISVSRARRPRPPQRHPTVSRSVHRRQRCQTGGCWWVLLDSTPPLHPLRTCAALSCIPTVIPLRQCDAMSGVDGVEGPFCGSGLMEGWKGANASVCALFLIFLRHTGPLSFPQ